MTASAWTFTALGAALAALATLVQMLRWLRVLSHEEYRLRAVPHFYLRWAFPPSVSANAVTKVSGVSSRILAAPFSVAGRAAGSIGPTSGLTNSPKERVTRRPISLPMVFLVVEALAITSGATPLVLVIAALFGLTYPFGLTIRSRTTPLSWGGKLWTTALFASALTVAVFFALWTVWTWEGAAAVTIVVNPLLVSVAGVPARIHLKRLERRLVRRARQRLAALGTQVVLIVGSAHGSEVRHYLRYLLGDALDVVGLTPPSPSAPQVAAHLLDAPSPLRRLLVEVTAPEPTAAKELASLLRPDVVIVTTVGFEGYGVIKSAERARAALTTLCESARSVVVTSEDEQLRQLPSALRSPGRSVLTAGRSPRDDVQVDGTPTQWTVRIGGVELGTVTPPPRGRATALACALAGARTLGLTPEQLARRLSELPAPPTTMAETVASNGLHVMVDLAGATPESARDALRPVRDATVTGRRVVVTPGLIGLGRVQASENYKLGALVQQANASLIAIGRTNAEALLEGFGGSAQRFDRRSEAVEWVRRHLGGDDAVLYLNEMPDYYP